MIRYDAQSGGKKIKIYKNEAQTQKAETDLIKSIDELKESYRIEDIEQLVIEDVHLVNITEKLKSKLEELVHLESLALNRCKLTSLDNLPLLPNLIQISLDNNFITVKLISYISRAMNSRSCTSIKSLSLYLYQITKLIISMTSMILNALKSCCSSISIRILLPIN